MGIKEKFKNLSSNNKIVLKNMIAAFVVKGGALLISLLATPAFIKYFNDDKILGVWYTLLSVLIWFLNFDLGIGNGIRNNLVKAFTEKDDEKAKRIISSGLFSITIVTLLLGIIGVSLICSLNLNWLFNIDKAVISYRTLRISTLFVFFAIIIRFELTFISSIFYALQKSSVNNFLALCVSVLQLIFVLVFRFDSPEQALKNLSLAYLILSNLPLIIAGIIIFATKLRFCVPRVKYIDKKHSKAVMSIGSVFFFCQILYMLIVNVNEFLVTKLFAPEFTTEYTFYYKIASIISMVVTLAMTPIWSVVTKAMAEGNFAWVEKLYKVIKIVGVIAILIQFLIVPFLQFVMDIWLGDNIIKVNYLTAMAFACFGGTFVYSGMLSTIVCGMAKMKLQAICYSIGVVCKFVFIFVLAKFVSDWSIVVWGNVLALLPYCILQHIDLNRFIKKKKLLNDLEKEN